VHDKRRSTVDLVQGQEWSAVMKDLVSAHYKRDRVRNCEETTWHICPLGMKAWPETGNQNVQTHLDANEKACQRIGIHLFVIPAGMAAVYHSLHRYVIGVMKAACRRM
jgi:hypothetical protein